MKSEKVSKLFIRRIICFILALSLAIPVFGISISASEPERPFLNTYAASYFHKLNSPYFNFGRNVEDTCGYVATGMLLSFYDSYWHDGFVPEDYEAYSEIDMSSLDINNSPGAKREGNWASVYTDYNDFIDDNSDKFLHLLLLQIGRDNLNLCDPTLKDWINEIFFNIPYEIDWLININDVSDVIEEYLSSINQSVGNNKTIDDCVNINVSCSWDLEYIFDDDPDSIIRDEMIEKIQDGIPVVYFGYSEANNSGHFMIAYDYDQSNDEIYFHTGWSSDTTMTDKESSDFIYTSKTAILWLEIDETSLSHSHAMNYSTSTVENAFCACQIYSTHPKHSSNHISITSDRIYYNNTNHWNNACHCKQPGPDSVVSLHDFNYVCIDDSSTRHLEDCVGCGYARYAEHEYNIPHSPTNTSHSLKCVCGAETSTTEAHYAYRFKPRDNSLHTVYCECGKEWTSPHVVESGSYISGNKYALCIACKDLVTVGMTLHPTINDLPRSENGSFILPSGIIVLADEDMEAYFDGTLEFYYPDDNLETE